MEEVAPAKPVALLVGIRKAEGKRKNADVALVELVLRNAPLVFEIAVEDARVEREVAIVVVIEVRGPVEAGEPARAFKGEGRKNFVGIKVGIAAVDRSAHAEQPVERTEIRRGNRLEVAVEAHRRRDREHVVRTGEVEVLDRERALPVVDLLHAVVVDVPYEVEREGILDRKGDIGKARVLGIGLVALAGVAHRNLRIRNEVRMPVELGNRGTQAEVVEDVVSVDALQALLDLLAGIPVEAILLGKVDGDVAEAPGVDDELKLAGRLVKRVRRRRIDRREVVAALGELGPQRGEGRLKIAHLLYLAIDELLLKKLLHALLLGELKRANERDRLDRANLDLAVVGTAARDAGVADRRVDVYGAGLGFGDGFRPLDSLVDNPVVGE